MAYQVNKPYPQPSGLAENKRAGRLLLRCYCGACSELTAVNQYFYHYLRSTGEYAPVSEALRQIAAVENHHLYLLGSCIRQMGVDPKLRTASGNGPEYWTARNVAYGREIKEMLPADIAHEHEIIRQYEHVCSRISNTQVQALITRIIEDERLHIRILTDLYNRYF